MRFGKILEPMDHRIDPVVIDNGGSMPVETGWAGEADIARMGEGRRFRKRKAANRTERVENPVEKTIARGTKIRTVLENFPAPGAEGRENNGDDSVDGSS